MKDEAGRRWEFVIKSWANGTENRRVYVLEQTSEYLKVGSCLLYYVPWCFGLRHTAFLHHVKSPDELQLPGAATYNQLPLR